MSPWSLSLERKEIIVNETILVEVAVVVAGLIIVLAMGWGFWQRYRQADAPQRTELIEGAVKRLVEAAEQMFGGPKMGDTKFAWVMNRLNRRFPDEEWDDLSDAVQSAVLHLNRDKATRNAIIHRNGTQGVPDR
jgi:hypothetical protein